jgi:2-aminoadipate transaminase
MDEHGLIPGALDQLLHALEHDGNLPRVKVVYVQSYHQNPMGLTLHADRRQRVLEIMRTFSQRPTSGGGILLLEDAAYRELAFDNRPLRSIKSYNEAHRDVALLQAFSKRFSPGIKTGYGLLPGQLIEPVLAANNARDFGSPNFLQHLLAEVLRSGLFDRHAAMLRSLYDRKCSAMLEAMQHDFALLPGVS